LRRPRGLLVVSLLIALIVAASSVALAARPAGLAVSKAVTPAGDSCRLTGPENGLEMNTVVASGMFKTIAMEKDVFTCTNGQQDNVIRDVETFIELVENQQGRLVEAVRVELAVCNKDFDLDNIRCSNFQVSLSQPVGNPLVGCDIGSFGSPSDPVVMNSAVNNGVIKTIKVEKEWYKCDSPQGPAIRHIYTFTEILERRTKLTNGNNTLRPFRHAFIGIWCQLNESAGTVDGCGRFPTSG
jgi:hypothetical protein